MSDEEREIESIPVDGFVDGAEAEAPAPAPKSGPDVEELLNDRRLMIGAAHVVADAYKQMEKAAWRAEEAKSDLKAKTESWKMAVEEQQRVTRECEIGKPAGPLFAPRPALTPSPEVASPPAEDDSWRSATLATLSGLTPGILKAFDSAGLTTMGQLADFTKTNSLTGIKGIGEAAAEKIRNADAVFWKERNKGKVTAEVVTNSTNLAPADHEREVIAWRDVRLAEVLTDHTSIAVALTQELDIATVGDLADRLVDSEADGPNLSLSFTELQQLHGAVSIWRSVRGGPVLDEFPLKALSALCPGAPPKPKRGRPAKSKAQPQAAAL